MLRRLFAVIALAVLLAALLWPSINSAADLPEDVKAAADAKAKARADARERAAAERRAKQQAAAAAKKSERKGKAKPPAVDLSNQFGVCEHLPKLTGPSLELLKSSGMRWVRVDLFWQYTEPQRGVYDFSPCDKFVADLESFGAHALFEFTFNNPLHNGGRADKLGVTAPANRDAYIAWALAAVSRYQGRGVIWEIWNEPDNKEFWRPDPNVGDYVSLTMALGKAIREAYPDEFLCGPAIAFTGNSTGQAFLEGCLKGGCLKYWDAISIHYYPGGQAPEVAAGVADKTTALIRKYAKQPVPLLVTETGYNLTLINNDEQLQAAYMPRLLLTWLASGIDQAFIYQWTDDFAKFGLLRADRTPRPAFSTVKTLIDEVGGKKFVRRLPLQDAHDYALEFSDGQSSVYAAWTTGKPKSVKIGGRSVAIGPSPVYGKL